MHTFPCTEKIKGSRCSFRIDHFAFLYFSLPVIGTAIFPFQPGLLCLQCLLQIEGNKRLYS